MKSKQFVIMVIILGLGIIVGSNLEKIKTKFVETPNDSRLSNQQQEYDIRPFDQSYQNDELKVAFQYPADYTVTTNNNWCGGENNCTFKQAIDIDGLMTIGKTANGDPSSLNYQNLTKLRVGEALLDSSQNTVRVKDVQVDGRKSYKFYTFFLAGGMGSQTPYITIFIPYNGGYYSIVYRDVETEKTYWRTPLQLQRLIDTIKFID